MRNSRPPKQTKTTPQVCQALTVKWDKKFSCKFLLWPSYRERAVPPTCTALASCQKVSKASRLVIAAAAARAGKGRSYGQPIAIMYHTRALKAFIDRCCWRGYVCDASSNVGCRLLRSSSV